MLHRNASLSVEGRHRLVQRCHTRPIAHVTAEMGISRQCASKWVNLCRSRSHRCWSGSVSVLVDESAEDAGAEHSVGVEVVYRGGVLPGFGW
ncbi:leucine zipper domain-containing protein [Saccharothrix longispora]|nr:leucine zipper domain-containing protein [Saccharothrix longispora]MDU0293512.1 leucine zipper domain-containing protein [Saccharothrix longispora]